MIKQILTLSLIFISSFAFCQTTPAAPETEAAPDMQMMMDSLNLEELLGGGDMNSLLQGLNMEGMDMKEINKMMESLDIQSLMGGADLSQLLGDMDQAQMQQLMEQSMKMLEGMDMSELQGLMEGIDMSEMQKMLEGMDMEQLQEMMPTPEQNDKKEDPKKLKKI